MKFATLRFSFWMVSLIIGLSKSAIAEDLSPELGELLEKGLRSKGPVQLEQFLNPDPIQEFCSDPNANIHGDEAGALMSEELEQIEYPIDEDYIGDWREGERIAQSGKGLRFNDSDDTKNGGNCYACHQIRKQELAYGTLGPSLYGYGKLRGYSREVLRYTWAKIFNPQAFLICSNMPRYGHKGILTMEQLRDIMGLLLDPKSPVNE
jgi:sulfur-oxidizing protein SoxX